MRGASRCVDNKLALDSPPLARCGILDFDAGARAVAVWNQ